MNSVAGQPDSTHLALDRTWLAHERTLMAWVRTATSMISFGFAIYKFFQYEAGQGAPITRGLLSMPRQLDSTGPDKQFSPEALLSRAKRSAPIL